MMTFLAILGAVFLILLGKFVYDSFLTNNTEKRWTDFRNHFPEEAKKIERDSVSNISRREDNSLYKKKSLERLATVLSCTPDQVKEVYLTKLKEQKITSSDFDVVMGNIK